MVRGVTVGKFLPLHRGHEYLINTAAKRCDQLSVIVCDRPEYPIPLARRLQWLTRIHPGVRVVPVRDSLDDDDSAGWAKATIAALGFVPDIAFTSEDYGRRWAQHMGCRHQLIDKPRRHVPISGTAIRNDPWGNWQYLHPLVRAYFAKRICVVGSESSGTTTLSRALAAHYRTPWVAEYGRQYTEEQQSRIEKEGWRTDDFVAIATEQNRLEDEAAARADKLLICDTDSFATTIWHERYMGGRSHEVEALAAGRRYELYLLTDCHIPFEQDGTRDGEAYREWMQQRFEAKLCFWGKPYVLLTGNHESRLRSAIGLIDSLLDDTAVQLPGLRRNRWRPEGGF